MIKLTSKLVILPRCSPPRVLSGVTDGIYPVRNRVFTNAMVNGEPRVLSLSQEFWSTIKDIMERDRLIESQQVAARRFKFNKMRYRYGR